MPRCRERDWGFTSLPEVRSSPSLSRLATVARGEIWESPIRSLTLLRLWLRWRQVRSFWPPEDTSHFSFSQWPPLGCLLRRLSVCEVSPSRPRGAEGREATSCYPESQAVMITAENASSIVSRNWSVDGRLPGISTLMARPSMTASKRRAWRSGEPGRSEPSLCRTVSHAVTRTCARRTKADHAARRSGAAVGLCTADTISNHCTSVCSGASSADRNCPRHAESRSRGDRAHAHHSDAIDIENRPLRGDDLLASAAHRPSPALSH